MSLCVWKLSSHTRPSSHLSSLPALPSPAPAPCSFSSSCSSSVAVRSSAAFDSALGWPSSPSACTSPAPSRALSSGLSGLAAASALGLSGAGTGLVR